MPSRLSVITNNTRTKLFRKQERITRRTTNNDENIYKHSKSNKKKGTTKTKRLTKDNLKDTKRSQETTETRKNTSTFDPSTVSATVWTTACDLIRKERISWIPVNPMLKPSKLAFFTTIFSHPYAPEQPALLSRWFSCSSLVGYVELTWRVYYP